MSKPTNIQTSLLLAALTTAVAFTFTFKKANSESKGKYFGSICVTYLVAFVLFFVALGLGDHVAGKDEPADEEQYKYKN